MKDAWHWTESERLDREIERERTRREAESKLRMTLLTRWTVDPELSRACKAIMAYPLNSKIWNAPERVR